MTSRKASLPVMNQPLRREISMDHTGYLGNTRVIHNNHYDASTQADIHHVALTYESEDEAMGRLHPRGRRGTASYSKQDIREQYCISDRGLGALETDRHSLFGCLSSHQNSPCSNRTSLLTVCVRQKIPSDENLQDLYRRHPADYAPYPRRVRYPWGPPPPEIYRYDEDLNSSYFRRKIHVDPSKYTWMPSDDESVRMERPRSVLEPCPTHEPLPPPPPPVARPKHVSFARSHTLASFDDAVVSLSSSSSQSGRMSRSQERLLDVRKVADPVPITRQPEMSDNLLVLEKLKRAPMKTQATQTEACLGRRLIPPGQLHLSPRTIHRVKMVSQGAQTNGLQLNGRKLMKSLSEMGTTSGIQQDAPVTEAVVEHEPLLRTHSDEPPRSPFIVTTPPPELLPLPSDSSSVTEESECKKEIFIDFKPLLPPSQSSSNKKPLMKTVSDGEILVEARRSSRADVKVPEKSLTSMSHDNIATEEEIRSFVPYFKNTPIRNEGIFRPFQSSVYSSMSESFEGPPSFMPQDSIDEEFHENIIYSGVYLSPTEGREFRPMNEDIQERSAENASLEDVSVVPCCLMPDLRSSPFASNDSLANDFRDHSDGIWNESQATVLQVDSGTDNGTALSSSDIATSPSSATLLTPSARRKHLLFLQHQQRSSMDTEALEEELVDQVPRPVSPRITIEPVGKELGHRQQYLSPHSAVSPARRKRVPEPPHTESPQPAVVPDLILSRTDSGKTNTDVSESTTTDDYITATSGTDSSRKSSTRGVSDKHQPQTQEGSSFESASSLYSLAKVDVLGDDMVVPTFSPPPIPEEASSLASTPVPEAGRSTPSDASSSSGSYSVDGSCPDLPHKPVVPSSKKVPSVSEDERSALYSSSGYYESPLEEDWKPSKDEKAVRKRPFTLDINTYRETGDLTSPTDKKTTHKHTKKADPNRLSPLKDYAKTEKQKRSKTRTRSPMQGNRKNQQHKRGSPLVRSPAVSDNYDTWEKAFDGGKATSDESSCERPLSSQVSPRKSKKTRDMRRKSTPRSPTSSKGRRRNGSEDKPSSLPGSLPRRRTSVQKTLDPETPQKFPSSGRLSPYSPAGSPNKRNWSPKTSPPDSSKLKALSAESLRSVSPGSDSVFYSDPSSHAAGSDHQVHCLHCGKEVDIVTTDEVDKSLSSNNGQQPDIVQPPAGFADSPKPKPGGRLYKKFDKRFRSEDRTQGDRRHHRHKSDARAKSEERGAKSDDGRPKLRPMARSTGASVEGLKATDSSPSVLPGAPDDEDDVGVYNVPYENARWIYIDEREEKLTWHKSDTEEPPRKESTSSVDSTESEQDFRKKYQAVTHRMVHRKSSLEMYKRQISKSFESDKTVVVRRESGEFGFRIHGSKPVVVSAIEPDTPAETSGLEVGDIVLAVNGVNVLDKSHSEVVKIAHAGSDTLTLEVARTCGVLSPNSADVHGGAAICSGYLWKLGGHASGAPSNKWIRRWFALKKDNCLYYYKTDSDKQPVGAMMLINYILNESPDADPGPTRSVRFNIEKNEKSIPVLRLAADTEEAAARWVDLLRHAIEESQMADALLEQTRRNLALPPNSIQKPDCFGFLVKLGTQWKAWSRRYCVLKDACLYFYQDVNAKCAFGVACLHGYRVQQTVSGSKKHAFEMIPSDPNQKNFYFHTETELDRKRWIAALEYSIDRWLKVG